MRVVYAGTPEFAVPALQAIVEDGHELVAVYTQPERPAGRGRQPRASAVKATAGKLGLAVHQPQTLSDETRTIAAYVPDALVVAAYGLRVPRELLGMPRFGCINIHASLLPRWRGAAPIQHAILAGDAHTGVTIMQMAAGIDTGDILLQRTAAIEAADTAASLAARVAELGADAIVTALADLAAGSLQPQPQDPAQITYAPRLDKADGALDWGSSAVQLERAVRAYNPWPGAYTQAGGRRLKVWAAEALEGAAPAPPGRVVATSPDGIDIATGEGWLRLHSVQLEGRKVVSAAALLHAYALDGLTLPC